MYWPLRKEKIPLFYQVLQYGRDNTGSGIFSDELYKHFNVFQKTNPTKIRIHQLIRECFELEPRGSYYQLKGEYDARLTEYYELKEARQASNWARGLSIVAIIMSILATYYASTREVFISESQINEITEAIYLNN